MRRVDIVSGWCVSVGKVELVESPRPPCHPGVGNYVSRLFSILLELQCCRSKASLGYDSNLGQDISEPVP